MMTVHDTVFNNLPLSNIGDLDIHPLVKRACNFCLMFKLFNLLLRYIRYLITCVCIRQLMA